jgi:hypothetical protein
MIWCLPAIYHNADAFHSGGAVVAALLSENAPLPKKNLFAAVRTEEQAQLLHPLGIKALRLDLQNEQAVVEAVLQNESMQIGILTLGIIIEIQDTD